MYAREKPTVLYTTPLIHHPPNGGPTLRVENSIKALAQIADLHLYSRVTLEQMGGERALEFFRHYCQSVHIEPQAGRTNRYAALCRRLINQIAKNIVGQNIFRPTSDNFYRVLQIANDTRPDLIWLGYGNISYPLLHYIKSRSSYPVVVDTDSVWSKYLLRGLPFVNSEAERRRIQLSGSTKSEEESWGTQLADVTTAVSEVDAEYYQSLTSNPRKVLLFSNVIDYENYIRTPTIVSDLQRPSLLLSGTFWSGSPMEHATRWFITKVLPRVRELLPNIYLYIVGKDSDHVMNDIIDPFITITGQVESVLPYLHNIDVALVPLWFESGTRFKILEAGACGVTVISTTLGAEGIHVTHEQDILIADTPDDFAASIIRVINDQEIASRLGNNLQQVVKEHYSLQKLINEGQKVLNYLASENVSSKPT